MGGGFLQNLYLLETINLSLDLWRTFFIGRDISRKTSLLARFVGCRVGSVV